MNNNNELTVVAYADDIVLIAESEDDLRNTTSILLNEGKEIGLKINESKTKYMIISRRNHNISYLKVEDYKFERVQSFNTWAQRSIKMLIATKKLKNELQQQIDATIV